MQITTSAIINKSPAQLWPLLCNSKMDLQAPCALRFFVPKPVECRLAESVDSVGTKRQCISNRGSINQKITLWQPPDALQFEMQDTDIYFGKCVTSIKESFTLEVVNVEQTKISRTTNFVVKGWLGWAKSIAICIGLKNVHWYVFKNWKQSIN